MTRQHRARLGQKAKDRRVLRCALETSLFLPLAGESGVTSCHDTAAVPTGSATEDAPGFYPGACGFESRPVVQIIAACCPVVRRHALNVETEVRFLAPQPRRRRR